MRACVVTWSPPSPLSCVDFRVSQPVSHRQVLGGDDGVRKAAHRFTSKAE